jgi:hypothetical protein
MSASDMLAQHQQYPCQHFLGHVGDMLANMLMLATYQPDKHMSVVLTLISTCQHPTFPAKGVIVATMWMWVVTPASTFVAIMQRQRPVAAGGANVVVKEVQK